jgi:hypothetical protein
MFLFHHAAAPTTGVVVLSIMWQLPLTTTSVDGWPPRRGHTGGQEAETFSTWWACLDSLEADRTVDRSALGQRTEPPHFGFSGDYLVYSRPSRSASNRRARPHRSTFPTLAEDGRLSRDDASSADQFRVLLDGP